MIIFSFPSTASLAQRVGSLVKAKQGKLHYEKFPDGESYLRFLTPVANEDVVLFHTMYVNQNEVLVDLTFAVETLKELGAKSVHLLIPYLAYMRQDVRFNPGECVSAPLLGKLLRCADSVVTINTHLHRIHHLNEVFSAASENLSAAGLLGAYAKKLKLHDPVFVGPDSESKPLVEDAAAICSADVTVLEKVRLNPRNVKSRLVDPPSLKGRDIVLIDDMITTGKTIEQAVKLLKPFKPRSFTVLCIHGVFSEKALPLLQKLHLRTLASTTTIPNTHAKIDITPLFAGLIRKRFGLQRKVI
ncbi:ribose-phosphate diphosphokinase [Candidatus Woesearchaeota archaeon]|nr:ribose-phosphate diphosphokinase [Candidatus Woesearchaeota archaeon]